MATAVRTVAALVVLAVVIVVLAWVFQRRLVYVPSGSPAAGPEQVLEGGSAVGPRTEDGLDLAAWHAPATAQATVATVLVLPGNAGSRAVRVPLARALAAEGLDVLLLDYPGIRRQPRVADGGGPGRRRARSAPAPRRRARRGPRAVGAVRREPRRGRRHPARPRAARRRAGAAQPVHLARRHRADRYPFLPVRALLADRFPVPDAIGSVTVPIVVVAGGADEIVPPAQRRAAAAAPYVEVPGLRHNDPAPGLGDDLP